MLEDLKLLLGLEDTDKKTEQQLQLILNATKQRLKFLLGGLEPPEEMEYIILDVSVIRFNRIGSEGLSLTVLRARAFPGLKMILPGTWMIFSLIWTASGRQGRKGEVFVRYDTPIFFRRVLPGEYDPTTGNYADDQVTEVRKMASVMDTRAEIMQIVYGGIRQGSVTVQLQNHYQKPFDRIRIGNTTYKVDYTRKLRVKQTFILSEVV